MTIKDWIGELEKLLGHPLALDEQKQALELFRQGASPKYALRVLQGRGI